MDSFSHTVLNAYFIIEEKKSKFQKEKFGYYFLWFANY